MKMLRNINDLKKAISATKNLGFVPTMGGLHNGHIALIKESKKKCTHTLVSIYVNPRQFNKLNDYKNYPRKINNDLKILKQLKIKYVFIPKTRDIYKKKRKKKIKLNKNQKILCAKLRKGHFEGVLDIMDRFINIIRPKYVFLGEKDFQQFFLIKKYINSKYKTKIILCKTVRDKNFIALSTRNFLLSKKNLNKAGLIAKNLHKFKKELIKKNKINYLILKMKKKLIDEFKIKIEYLEFRNIKNLNNYKNKNKSKLFIAYYLNKIRLIDNF